MRNPAARKGGLDISLFRRLSVAHPEAVVDLTHQYRMNEDIMLLSNRLISGDRLRCGNEEVASQALSLPDGGKFLCGMHTAKQVCGEGCWMDRLLSEKYFLLLLWLACIDSLIRSHQLQCGIRRHRSPFRQ